MPYLHSISTALPKNKILQTEILDWMKNHFAKDAIAQRKMGALYRGSGIESRYSVLDDFNTDHNSFYDSDKIPTTSNRNAIFQKKAPFLAFEACKKSIANAEIKTNEITHLITVSCTGLYAPGLEFFLVDALKLNNTVQKFPIQFVGCYAMFTALNLSNIICKSDPKACVLIVGVELCTLHFQKSSTNDDLLANTIFADGSSACIVSAQKPAIDSLQFDKVKSQILPSSNKEMSWTVSETGFQMKLSTYVSEFLSKNISLDLLDISEKTKTTFAIHPGGLKIINACETALTIDENETKFSREVLKKHGNMSSVTILYVLAAIFKDKKQLKNHPKVIAMGFGPGLSLETIHFDYVSNHQ